jgi:4-hydroxybenzoyl-CoA thioesterase
MTTFIHRTQFTIEWGQCDPAGMVFSSRFFGFFDTSTWLLFKAALGVPPEKLAPTFDIIGIPLVDARARFVTAVRFGDRVDMESNVGEFRRSSFKVQHRLFVKDELAVEGEETRVWAGRDKTKPSGMTSLPIPADVIARFKPA